MMLYMVMILIYMINAMKDVDMLVVWNLYFEEYYIGCGAYGLPLTSMLKASGKKAIHLGGATQILFGIKGKRWDHEATYDYVRNFYNENWVKLIYLILVVV